jgi:hypothetical protein
MYDTVYRFAIGDPEYPDKREFHVFSFRFKPPNTAVQSVRSLVPLSRMHPLSP